MNSGVAKEWGGGGGGGMELILSIDMFTQA